MESSILSEVDDTSILRTGLPTPLWLSSQLATGLSSLAPRSGLERSDFVPWHKPESAEWAEIRSLAGDNRTFSNPASTRQQCNVPQLTQFARRCGSFTTSGFGPPSTTRAGRPLWSV